MELEEAPQGRFRVNGWDHLRHEIQPQITQMTQILWNSISHICVICVICG